jgi:parallel beta-helix repeat protein
VALFSVQGLRLVVASAPPRAQSAEEEAMKKTPFAIVLLALLTVTAACAPAVGSSAPTGTAGSSLALVTPAGPPWANGPAALPRQGNTYYVSPGGDDSDPGTIDFPWQTIQHAADTLAAGDTLYIRAGTYPEQVIPQNSGSAGQAITYAAYPGEAVTLDGAVVTVPQYQGLFYIGARDYIQVSGLRIANSNEAGILADGCSHVTIENNSTYNTSSSGIGVWGCSNVVVAGNRVEEACGGGMQECISVGGTDTFAVHDNEVLNCHKEGIDAKDGSSNGQVYRNHVHHTDRVGFYVDAWDKHTYNIALFQNVAYDSLDNNGFALASEAGGLLENVRVYNNIAYNNRYLGLAFSNCCPDLSPTHPMRGITVVNNTFYNNGLDPWGGGITVDNPDIQDVTIRNNIVSQNLSFQIVVSPGVPTATLSIDHNLIDGFRGYEGEVYGDAYVEGDPRFVDPAGGNFHLQGDSPAIDQGSATDAPNDDYDGQPRPAGAGYDIGADEYVAFTHWVYLPVVYKD